MSLVDWLTEAAAFLVSGALSTHDAVENLLPYLTIPRIIWFATFLIGLIFGEMSPRLQQPIHEWLVPTVANTSFVLLTEPVREVGIYLNFTAWLTQRSGLLATRRSRSIRSFCMFASLVLVQYPLLSLVTYSGFVHIEHAKIVAARLGADGYKTVTSHEYVMSALEVLEVAEPIYKVHDVQQGLFCQLDQYIEWLLRHSADDMLDYLDHRDRFELAKDMCGRQKRASDSTYNFRSFPGQWSKSASSRQEPFRSARLIDERLTSNLRAMRQWREVRLAGAMHASTRAYLTLSKMPPAAPNVYDNAFLVPPGGLGLPRDWLCFRRLLQKTFNLSWVLWHKALSHSAIATLRNDLADLHLRMIEVIRGIPEEIECFAVLGTDAYLAAQHLPDKIPGMAIPPFYDQTASAKFARSQAEEVKQLMLSIRKKLSEREVLAPSSSIRESVKAVFGEVAAGAYTIPTLWERCGNSLFASQPRNDSIADAMIETFLSNATPDELAKANHTAVYVLPRSLDTAGGPGSAVLDSPFACRIEPIDPDDRAEIRNAFREFQASKPWKQAVGA